MNSFIFPKDLFRSPTARRLLGGLALMLALAWPSSLAADSDPGAERLTFARGQSHYFRKNTHDGDLLILIGTVRNGYNHPRSRLRLRGQLLSDSGKSILAERYFYAGNILSEAELKSLPIGEIMDRLARPGGQDGANLNVQPGGQVPFMIVFNQLPDAMSEYQVEPVSSFPADQTPAEAEETPPSVTAEETPPSVTAEETQPARSEEKPEPFSLIYQAEESPSVKAEEKAGEKAEEKE